MKEKIKVCYQDQKGVSQNLYLVLWLVGFLGVVLAVIMVTVMHIRFSLLCIICMK